MWITNTFKTQEKWSYRKCHEEGLHNAFVPSTWSETVLWSIRKQWTLVHRSEWIVETKEKNVACFLGNAARNLCGSRIRRICLLDNCLFTLKIITTPTYKAFWRFFFNCYTLLHRYSPWSVFAFLGSLFASELSS
jgi:hypothetical protein